MNALRYCGAWLDILSLLCHVFSSEIAIHRDTKLTKSTIPKNMGKLVGPEAAQRHSQTHTFFLYLQTGAFQDAEAYFPHGPELRVSHLLPHRRAPDPGRGSRARTPAGVGPRCLLSASGVKAKTGAAARWVCGAEAHSSPRCQLGAIPLPSRSRPSPPWLRAALGAGLPGAA